IQQPDANVYSAATIELGRLAAAAGACNFCHVGNDVTPFAGGRRFDTPFGAVYATNITPDVRYLGEGNQRIAAPFLRLHR
ncbi:hypothetical protein ACEQ6A_35815, partial [Rhizobium brockwellii]|uniref:hypothetical protein n=1 Tax=Rhizobium brockwellii TaxID=3019932 RepID=UPI003F952E42